MSSSDEDMGFEVIYPVGEATEVPQTGGGLFKTVLEDGNLQSRFPPKGAKVVVHYVGTLEADGSKFDSSRDRADPFEFTIGQGQVIKGWDMGVATMKKGEKAVLKCLPEYGYGANGSPPKIPANATLLFEVELLDWSKNEDISEGKDRSLMKETRVEGNGFDHPDYESEVVVDVAVVAVADDETDGDTLFEKKDWAVLIGDTDLPQHLEQVIKAVKAKETAAVDVKAFAATEANAEWHIAAGAAFRFVVTVQSTTSVKPFNYAGAEKVAMGVERKDAGNAYFKTQQWAKAVRKYERALEFLEQDYGLSDDEKVDNKKALHAAYTNAAQAFLNMGDWAAAIAKCDKCLESDSKNLKALYRRGKARNNMEDWDEAKADLHALLALDAGNADAQNELAAVAAKQRAFDNKAKKAYSNMFAKIADADEEE
jgi:FK506-binding protein 4/5